MIPPPLVIPGAVLLYSFMLPPLWRGLFFFLPCAVWRYPCHSTAFFFPCIYFHSLLRFFPCAPRVAFVRLSTHISAGCMVLSAALYRTFAALRYAHSRPISQPVPGLRCAAPLRPWGGCTLAPAAPEGATPQAVPVSECKKPPISISGTGGEFLPEPVTKSLIVAKSKVDEGAPESRCSQVLPHSRYSR